jgi:hypothetical protein
VPAAAAARAEGLLIALMSAALVLMSVIIRLRWSRRPQLAAHDFASIALNP